MVTTSIHFPSKRLGSSIIRRLKRASRSIDESVHRSVYARLELVKLPFSLSASARCKSVFAAPEVGLREGGICTARRRSRLKVPDLVLGLLCKKSIETQRFKAWTLQGAFEPQSILIQVRNSPPAIQNSCERSWLVCR